MIKSSRINLRPLEVEDVDDFYLWSCDKEITQFSLSSYVYPKSKTDISKWLTTINDSSKVVSFGVAT